MNASNNTRQKLLKKFSRNLSGWLLIAPSLFLFIFLIWRPIVVGISYSFFDLKGFSPIEFIGFENYKNVLSDTNFIQTLWNTIKYVIWSLVIGFLPPFICAILINEMLHLKGFFRVTTYLPVVIPGIAVSLIWRMMYLDSTGGLLNMILIKLGGEATRWLSNPDLVIPLIIIAMTWNTFGGTMVMYLSVIQGINKELYEAASLDGANIPQRLRYVLIPHMRGMLLLMLINQIIGVFNITEQPLTMTGGGPNGASMSLGLTNYFYAFKYGHYDKSLALGVIIFIILFALTLVYFTADKKIND